jgi:Flp pilus assembly protein CpaB
MKPKTLILMVVAVTCGLGASYMTSRLLAERQTSDDGEKVTILVAKKTLDMGVTIKKVEDLFEEKKVTKGEEPKNAIIEPKDLQGRVLKITRKAGDFITGEDLLSDKDIGLSSMMTQGYRAIGIRVTPESIASGLASLPLSRVDLIWTVRRATDKDSSSRILLENVLVLAADSTITRVEGSGAMPASVVTVALKPEDILKVSMARELGTISMVLRKFNDHQKAEVSSVTVEELITGTAGKRETEDDSWVEGTAQPAISKVELPELPKDIQPVEVAKDKGTLHRLRLIEGDKERIVEYWLDDNGQVIHNDVVRSEIGAAPPRPPQVQPPQVQPRQPAAPAPAPPPAPSPSAPNGHKV